MAITRHLPVGDLGQRNHAPANPGVTGSARVDGMDEALAHAPPPC